MPTARRSTVKPGSENAADEAVAQPPMRPQSFMFIDFQEPGKVLKPDKAVRSFVMHQARRHRPWSTRKNPPSPDTESAPKRRRKDTPVQDTDESAEPSPVSSSFILERNPSESVSGPKSQSIGTSPASQPCTSRSPNLGHSCTLPTGDHDSCSQIVRAAGSNLREPAQGVADPFNALAVRTDAETSALIHHFVSILSPRLLPVDIRQSSTVASSEWLAGALRDDASGGAFTYAILCSTALHRYLIGGGGREKILYYKGRAISEINSNLSDPERSISDNNIAAVFTLLTIEESMLALTAATSKSSEDEHDWTKMQKLIHLNGLRTMIRQRGGLAGLGTNRCLQTFILMHSIAHSITSFHQPYTTLLDDAGDPVTYDIPSFEVDPSSFRTLRNFRSLDTDSDLMGIISDIVIFTSDLTKWYTDRGCKANPLDFQKHASLLMYRLFDWYSKTEKERAPQDQCICLALLIFVVRVVHPQDNQYKTMTMAAVRRLREALEQTTKSTWGKSPDALLWVVTIGSLAAQRSTDMAYFDQYCRTAFTDAGFEGEVTCEEILARMHQYPWIGTVLDQDGRVLWRRIGLVKVEPYDDLVEQFAALNTEITDDDAVGVLTSTRFFSKST